MGGLVGKLLFSLSKIIQGEVGLQLMHEAKESLERALVVLNRMDKEGTSQKYNVDLRMNIQDQLAEIDEILNQ